MNCYLGFDTSCYTTSVACVDEGGTVLEERAVLSVPLGGRGLRQSDALFQHNRNLSGLTERLLGRLDPADVRAVAVSAKPTAAPDSYMPVFLAGRLAAVAVSSALRVPLYETDHQAGHLRAALLGNERLLSCDSFLAVHISGGTTDVLLVGTDRSAQPRLGKICPLGCSNDLHAGQFVDRAGVAMGLPFPCGPHLEALALADAERSVRIPASVRGLHCSLSGAETRVQRLLAEGLPQAEAAYAVYDCLARTLAKLLKNAAEETGSRTVLLSGGVASSALLRTLLRERISGGIELVFGKNALSSDNAVGTALLARDLHGRAAHV